MKKYISILLETDELENASEDKLEKLSKDEERKFKKMPSSEMIDIVYKMLQNREIHPSGKFDSNGRWYAKNDNLINVRSPSRRWPYSQMVACRTKKYVQKVYDKFKPKDIQQLIQYV